MVAVLLIPWDSPRFLMKHESSYYNHYCKKLKAYEMRRSASLSASEGQEADDNLAATLTRDTVQLSFWERLTDPIRFRYGPNPAFGYHSRTYETLLILHGHPLIAAKELLYSHCQLTVQRLSLEAKPDPDSDIDFSLNNRPDWFRRLKDIFSPGYLRREMAAAAVVMASQQLSGINVLIFYSSLIFSPHAADNVAGVFSRDPLWLNLGIGMVNLLAALPAYWWIETRGRRWLLLITVPFLAITMAGAAASSSFPLHSVARRVAVGLFTILFTMFYSPGMGPVPFTLSAELFPLEHRMVGMSIAVSINFLLGGIFALAVPLIQRQSILLGMFSITNIIAWVLIWIYVREPDVDPADGITAFNALRLEEVFQIYRPSHWEHVQFQWQNKSSAFNSVWDFVRGRLTPVEKRSFFINWLWETEDTKRAD